MYSDKEHIKRYGWHQVIGIVIVTIIVNLLPGCHSSSEKIQDDMEEDECELYKYDFGEVGMNERVNHIFTITNPTSDTLHVRKVISSCECTEGKLSSQIILPKSECEIEVSFQDSIPDVFVRTVTVYFEENNREISFEVSGKIN